jgi:hypothetical protein
MLRFKDSEINSGVDILSTNLDYGFVAVKPPSVETQKGTILAENSVNTGMHSQ